MDTARFHNKYRITSARLASWDYGSNAAYFVTLCTQDRRHAFGKVQDGQMHLSPLGQTAWDCWRVIPEHFPFVILDEFVVMPNHVHGIIVIDKPDVETQNCTVETQNFTVETQNIASLPPPPPPPPSHPNQFGPQSQNLAAIVRGYKIGVTKFARQQQIPFAWQPRYYDHIIRHAEEHDRIRHYIIENPQKWAGDRFYQP